MKIMSWFVFLGSPEATCAFAEARCGVLRESSLNRGWGFPPTRASLSTHILAVIRMQFFHYFLYSFWIIRYKSHIKSKSFDQICKIGYILQFLEKFKKIFLVIFGRFSILFFISTPAY